MFSLRYLIVKTAIFQLHSMEPQSFRIPSWRWIFTRTFYRSIMYNDFLRFIAASYWFIQFLLKILHQHETRRALQCILKGSTQELVGFDLCLCINVSEMLLSCILESFSLKRFLKNLEQIKNLYNFKIETSWASLMVRVPKL